MNLEDTIASSAFSQAMGQKPESSHTVGNNGQGVSGTGVMTQVARQSGQAIMAHTFTGKMFSMRNNSLKAQAGHNNGQNASHHGVNNLVGEKSGSV